jgi:hypothetical protein
MPIRDGYATVFVDWVDSSEIIPNSDLSAYELPSPQRIFQAGFLIHDDEDHIVVAGGMKPDLETYDYVIAIPRCSIVAIRYLTIEGSEVSE